MFSRNPLKERRRHPRSPVSWPVRLWIGVDVFALARAVNASLRGIRLNTSGSARPLLKIGEPYRLEIGVDPSAEIVCMGELRHLSDGGLGLELGDELTVLPAATLSDAPPSSLDGLALPEHGRPEGMRQHVAGVVAAARLEAFFHSLVRHLTRAQKRTG